jgi:hypothetical protein
MGHAIPRAFFVVIVPAYNDAVSTLGIGKNHSPHGSGSAIESAFLGENCRFAAIDGAVLGRGMGRCQVLFLAVSAAEHRCSFVPAGTPCVFCPCSPAIHQPFCRACLFVLPETPSAVVLSGDRQWV